MFCQVEQKYNGMSKSVWALFFRPTSKIEASDQHLVPVYNGGIAVKDGQRKTRLCVSISFLASPNEAQDFEI